MDLDLLPINFLESMAMIGFHIIDMDDETVVKFFRHWVYNDREFSDYGFHPIHNLQDHIRAIGIETIIMKYFNSFFVRGSTIELRLMHIKETNKDLYFMDPVYLA